MLSGVPGAWESWYAEMAEWVPAIFHFQLSRARKRRESEKDQSQHRNLCAAKAALHLNGKLLALAAVSKVQDRYAQC